MINKCITYYTIYQITNKINGKIYIGSHKTKNLNDNYLGSGKYLKHAITKHGVQNFTKEILFVFDTAEEMYAKEAELVDIDFIAESNTYNLKVGGFDYLNSEKYDNPTHSKEYLKALRDKTPEAYKTTEFASKMRKAMLQRYAEGFESAFKCPEIGKKGAILAQSEKAKAKRKLTRERTHFQQGEKNSQFGKRWAWLNKAGAVIKVPLLDKDHYLSAGWNPGTKQ